MTQKRKRELLEEKMSGGDLELGTARDAGGPGAFVVGRQRGRSEEDERIGVTVAGRNGLFFNVALCYTHAEGRNTFAGRYLAGNWWATGGAPTCRARFVGAQVGGGKASLGSLESHLDV